MIFFLIADNHIVNNSVQKLIIITGIDQRSSKIISRFIEIIHFNQNSFVNFGLLMSQDLNELFERHHDKTILVQVNEYNPFYTTLQNKLEIFIIRGVIDIRTIFYSKMMEEGSFDSVFSKYEIDGIISTFKAWDKFNNLIDIQIDVDSVSVVNEKIGRLLMKIGCLEHISTNNSDSHAISSLENEVSELKQINTKFLSIFNKLELGIIQYYSRKWLKEWNYRIIPNFYNYYIFWASQKVINHIIYGTFLERIFDSFHKNQKRIHKFKHASKDKYLYNLNSNVKINLYKDSHLCHMIINDCFEKDELTFATRFLKSGDFFLDIGSNIGLFSLIASPIIGNKGSIMAIEPGLQTYNRLVENVKLNKFTNIHTLNLALSNIEEEREFFVDKTGYDAWNSLGKPSAGNFHEKEVIQTKTLDRLVVEYSHTQIDLIKIDVEGWELPVLQGAKQVLSQKNAPVLMVEFTEENAKNAGFTCRKIFEIGIEYGYRWYEYSITENQLNVVNIKDEYLYENLFAIKSIELAMIRLQQ